ncbi:delta-aminolevulinic acid dehydratase [Clostridium baratii]|uniref:Delta-aminolevulinic acid dehydratase n=1 Tax=Clostridium baratii TaxID=1561 RepID=A0A174PFQ5_9CLOT|nr:porphobilinogen synthase [Clostridium baratii]OPF50417.1 delta-aminolevulinic acid dehydratase [Clostridium baratii]OPF53182.1 delta-aminolevulinic acid dehydratase [Clostridium baratii]OPF55198.1 delta-aminolevulinic acid dehydratase [Clostridium baratii]OPF61148.1 delta-aminolevulinic acid dehydratase [Clostridium baratii]CUP57640.1 delta-aminolevulinic acid dehydratase HemB [Clostridium baratii]
MRRGRRLRTNECVRDLVRETVLTPSDFILPIFVVEGEGIKREIESLPGVYHYSVDMLDEIIEETVSLGIKGIMLFGIPDHKDCCGSEAYADNGIVQRATRRIREITDKLIVSTDVCMCEYTDHGHCGIIHDGDVDNDETLDYLCKIAVSHAKAGSQMIAPSDMMDGRVLRIREALDNAGYKNVSIMSYSAKYCSAYYGPFRAAANSAPSFGDRKTYQMDPANRREAIREVMYDIEEGADIVMVKPALSYLDIVRDVRNEVNLPVAAYNVSGEYAMIKAAGKMGLIDEERTILETLTSMKRAGADIIITYHALEASRLLRK